MALSAITVRLDSRLSKYRRKTAKSAQFSYIFFISYTTKENLITVITISVKNYFKTSLFPLWSIPSAGIYAVIDAERRHFVDNRQHANFDDKHGFILVLTAYR